MNGYPLPPLFNMRMDQPEESKANATYYGEDMNWQILGGEDDEIQPALYTLTAYQQVFNALGI